MGATFFDYFSFFGAIFLFLVFVYCVVKTGFIVAAQLRKKLYRSAAISVGLFGAALVGLWLILSPMELVQDVARLWSVCF